MLTYEKLKKKPREFLSATGMSQEEFEILLPNCAAAYDKLYPRNLTVAGQARLRRNGAGVTGSLSQFAQRLLFMLVYHKTNPLQTRHGLHFGLSQAQTNYWIHRLLPVLQQTLAALGMKPERAAGLGATTAATTAGGANLAIAGTERRLQRPVDPLKQREKSSGQQQAHTDKNILVGNENRRRVIYLSPTVEGQKHDSRAATEAAIAYPANATLDKDPGFQGYEPAGVLTLQSKKKRKVKS